ncbi:MAG: M4 family metallopeptidase [Lentisphaerae bacterium]|nr:M4 family metallopeptidase [Lentisphaerota bacterium]
MKLRWAIMWFSGGLLGVVIAGGALQADKASPKSTAVINGTILAGEGGAQVSVTGLFSNSLYWLFNPAWAVYNADNSGAYADSDSLAYRPAASWGASDPTEMSAAYNFDLIQAYYLSVHSRNSYDAAGTQAVAYVHMWGGEDNAYWSPEDQAFFFYPGSQLAELAVLDVCAHEFTHAVTEKTAGLVYQREPGALNESFSDIFGALVEFASQDDGRSSWPGRAAGKADWLLGEDCAYPVATALRDLRNPEPYGQPSRYRGTLWYSGWGDNGGVHYNSGVQNYMAYLLAEGGAGINDGIAYAVTGLGIENMGRVAYRALTVYCAPNTDHHAARAAWLSAAEDINQAWTANVQAAWSAVGVDNSTPASSSNLRVLGLNNDYDGDQHGDLTIYDRRNGNWYCWSHANRDWLANGVNFGSSNYLPVPGDYNGGGKSDALLYAPLSASWSIWYLEDSTRATATNFGGADLIPAPGDYDGDGITDASLYNTRTGNWFIWSSRSGTWLVNGGVFGESGYFPVPGDYDGDGRSDLALYAEASGDWLILYAGTGELKQGNLGGPHYVPAPGDYDGDGVTEVTVYDYWYGGWYIYSPVAGWIMNGFPWGGYPYLPVSGDFDGDGVSDLVVYSAPDAHVHLYFSSGLTEHLANFGGQYIVPVVYWPLYGYM